MHWPNDTMPGTKESGNGHHEYKVKWTSFLFAKRQFLAQTLKLSTQTSRDTLCTGNEASIEAVFLLLRNMIC